MSRVQAARDEILTVGHSTRGPDELEQLLRAHGVAVVLDVRAHPGSRRMPHFGREALERSLAAADIGYEHLPELGGRRRPTPDSPNGGWRNEQFQGYADHLATAGFERGLERAMAAARKDRCALMCAEAPWWRCHRRLMADALVVRGWRVLHVMGAGPPTRHEPTEFAVVDGERITYPPAQTTIDL
ncbi:MAG: DUF488 domain-containing protein [Thermoleophilaceae bacterium]|nr:DUF488 domain-containing protein [Thermoleophilaceae bacterium]